MYLPWNVMVPLVGLPSEFRVISYKVPKSYINITLNITWRRRHVRWIWPKFEWKFLPLFWFSVQIWIWGSISNLTLPLISSTFHIRHQKLHDYSLTYNGWSWVDCCTCPGISWSTPSGLPQGISSNFGQRHQKLHDYSLTYNKWFWGGLVYMPWNAMIPLVGLPVNFE